MKRYVLEYRLAKGNEKYEPIYFYENIGLDQVLARRECEFFVKEGVTYKQLFSSIEDGMFVIYVDKFEEGPIEAEDLAAKGAIKLEIRELKRNGNHPLIESFYLDDHLDVLSYIGSVYLALNRKEWERDSAEVDEDRSLYVMYVTPTGYEYKEGEYE